MTGADAASRVIDWLLERRYGAQYSAKWWMRVHTQDHRNMVVLACPECPDAAELYRLLQAGLVIASAADIKAAIRRADEPEGA